VCVQWANEVKDFKQLRAFTPAGAQKKKISIASGAEGGEEEGGMNWKRREVFAGLEGQLALKEESARPDTERLGIAGGEVGPVFIPNR